jgi:hypothetical protein
MQIDAKGMLVSESHRQGIWAVLCLACFLTMAQASPLPQDVTNETYRRVMDIVFEQDAALDGAVLFGFVLRFSPPSGPESQMVVRRSEGEVRVIEYIATTRISVQLSDIRKELGREDPAAMAKLVNVSKREVVIPVSRVLELHKEFFKSLTKSTDQIRRRGEEFDRTGGSTLLLHGVGYELWYIQQFQRMYFDLYDVDKKQGGKAFFPIVDWMNSVRTEIQEAKRLGAEIGDKPVISAKR